MARKCGGRGYGCVPIDVPLCTLKRYLLVLFLFFGRWGSLSVAPPIQHSPRGTMKLTLFCSTSSSVCILCTVSAYAVCLSASLHRCVAVLHVHHCVPHVAEQVAVQPSTKFCQRVATCVFAQLVLHWGRAHLAKPSAR